MLNGGEGVATPKPSKSQTKGKVLRYGKIPYCTVLLRTVLLRRTKLRNGMFLEEYGAENNSAPYRGNRMFDSCFRLLYCSAINAQAFVVCWSRISSNGARKYMMPDRAKCWGHILVFSQPTMLLSTAAHSRVSFKW